MKRKYHSHDVLGSQLHINGSLCDERRGANLAA
jgi:hypothetical protein